MLSIKSWGIAFSSMNEMIHAEYPHSIGTWFVGEEQYLAIWPRIVKVDLQICLLQRKYQMALQELDRASAHYEDSSSVDFYRAEIYRSMADHPLDAAEDTAWTETGKKASRKLIANQALEPLPNDVDPEVEAEADTAANLEEISQ